MLFFSFFTSSSSTFVSFFFLVQFLFIHSLVHFYHSPQFFVCCSVKIENDNMLHVHTLPKANSGWHCFFIATHCDVLIWNDRFKSEIQCTICTWFSSLSISCIMYWYYSLICLFYIVYVSRRFRFPFLLDLKYIFFSIFKKFRSDGEGKLLS